MYISTFDEFIENTEETGKVKLHHLEIDNCGIRDESGMLLMNLS